MLRVFLAVIFAVFCAASARAEPPSIQNNVAVLRALDKVTAHVEELNVPIGKPLTFGRLTITVRTCRTTPPEDAPEAAAYLDIDESKADEKVAAIFTGWMFASSPALSALQNPVYDVWLIGCKNPAAK